MIHFYPRNPYRYAAAGNFTKRKPQGMTKVEKRLCAVVWLAALASMAFIYIRRFGISF